MLAKSFEKRDELRDEEIYLLPALTKEDARKENRLKRKMLKKKKRTSRRRSSKGENQNQEFRAVQ